MRPLGSELLAAQKASTGRPWVSIQLNNPAGGFYLYETLPWGEAGRLMSVIHTEGAFSGGAVIRLRNYDGLLDGIDFTGFRGFIKWGFFGSFPGGVIADGSTPAYIYVWSQRSLSEEGELVVELTCIDMWERIARAIVRGATKGPRPGWPGDTTIIEMITSLLSDPDIGLNLNFIVDSSDSQASTYTPDYFIDLNTPVRDVIRELLSMTECGIRMRTDGLHLFHMQDIDPIDYTYGTDHKFFSSDASEQSAPEYNYIMVQNRTLEEADTEEGYYYGVAQDTILIAKFGLMPQIITLDWVESNEEAAILAATWLKRMKEEATQGSIVAPMNCGQEVFDKVQVIDDRSGAESVGRVGQITRVFAPGQYTIELRLGGVRAAGFLEAVSSLMGIIGPAAAFGRQILEARQAYEPPRARPSYLRPFQPPIGGFVPLSQMREPWQEREELGRITPVPMSQWREPWQERLPHNPTAAVIRGTTGLLGEPSQVLRSITGLAPYPMVPTTPRGSGGYTTREVYSPGDLRLIATKDLILKAGGGLTLDFLGSYELRAGDYIWLNSAGDTSIDAEDNLFLLAKSALYIRSEEAGIVHLEADDYFGIFSNRVLFNFVQIHDDLDDLALIRQMKPDPENPKLIDPTTAPIISSDGMFSLGDSFGVLFGAVKQLADRLDKLEGKDEHRGR